jgi:hemerythrin HHE cation binding domain-containing protein
VIDKLRQDHDMVASLLGEFEQALTQAGSAEQVAHRLDGIAAIMESHFRYEERQLLDVLATLRLDSDPERLLGPLSAD